MDPAVCFAYIAVGSLLFLFSRIVYCYYRLRHIPGPFWAAWTNIPRAFWVQSGHAHLIHKRLHEQYGPLVRVGPEAVSVDAPEAIPIIYPTKPGFVKVREIDMISVLVEANSSVWSYRAASTKR